jgi:ethanolamine utilization protein EutA
VHELDIEHVHTDGETEQNHPFWRSDRIELRSVGIDIGSSTSHLIFSTLELRRQSGVLSSRFELAGRRIDYASPILLTPFTANGALDVSRLSDFFDFAYVQAGITKAGIDTGAVIATGDAARKDNAEAVVRLFSQEAGKFVCASAGPLLEAKMAAYGSGAVARSAEADREATVLNIDVGGGTSKLALAREGRVIEATALNVGARLITFAGDETLTKIESAAALVAGSRGISLELGTPVREKARLDLAAALVDALLEVAARRRLSSLTQALMLAPPLRYGGDIDVVMFSGGVSEYFYRRDVPDFGDIGALLARLLRQRVPRELAGIEIERPLHGIRATVIGASQFTVQVSGNTLHISAADLLPLRDVQVVVIEFAEGTPTATQVENVIRGRMAECEAPAGRPIALAIRWPHGPAYAGLDALACGIARASAERRSQRQALIVVLDVDVARLTGAILSERTGYDRIICIDGIDLRDFDYIDIGEQRPDSHVVTVVVKSLVFTG